MPFITPSMEAASVWDANITQCMPWVLKAFTLIAMCGQSDRHHYISVKAQVTEIVADATTLYKLAKQCRECLQ